jgi:hypothetical protein
MIASEFSANDFGCAVGDAATLEEIVSLTIAVAMLRGVIEKHSPSLDLQIVAATPEEDGVVAGSLIRISGIRKLMQEVLLQARPFVANLIPRGSGDTPSYGWPAIKDNAETFASESAHFFMTAEERLLERLESIGFERARAQSLIDGIRP